MSQDKNVVISGRTGEGKTTSIDDVMSNALKFKPRNIVVCDCAEMKVSDAIMSNVTTHIYMK